MSKGGVMAKWLGSERRGSGDAVLGSEQEVQKFAARDDGWEIARGTRISPSSRRTGTTRPALESSEQACLGFLTPKARDNDIQNC